MSNLPAVSGKNAIKAFQRAGFEVVRISKSSHHIMKRPGHRYLLSVPVHANTDLKTGTLRALIRDAGLTEDEFAQLL